MKAMQKLDEAREKLAEANKDFDNVRRKAKQAKMNFERVKQERYDLFMKCFEHVSNTIDGIYKNLARNQSAQVDLLGIQAKALKLCLGFPWSREPRGALLGGDQLQLRGARQEVPAYVQPFWWGENNRSSRSPLLHPLFPASTLLCVR